MAVPTLWIVHEHPHWFTPLFSELERREIPFRRIDLASASFDSHDVAADDVVFNRLSPSAWTRGRGSLIRAASRWIADLEGRGIRVLNGSTAWHFEISKAAQLELLAAQGVPAPAARATSSRAALLPLSRELRFPLIVKPNVGGSGAGIRLLRNGDELAAAIASDDLETPLDGVYVLQEYHRPAGSSIVRVETLNGEYLYGIRIHLDPDSGFDLCPADVCRTTGGENLSSAACPVGAEKSGLSVESFTPPADVIKKAERIARAAGLDVGGIEYLESADDGEIYFYDINALSNFVADPVRVIGFDATARLVDHLEEELQFERRLAAGGAL